MAPQPVKLIAGGHSLEVSWLGPPAGEGPTLVFLHEGLGSVSAWRDFPSRAVNAAGCGALVYSRWGYGDSEKVKLPRPLSYMHDEAVGALPAVLEQAGIHNAILVGHSDGASIALIFAGSGLSAASRVKGLVLLAPHVFVEDLSIQSITAARTTFETTDLRTRLGNHHEDVDGAFWGWNRAWLDPEFKKWNIEAYLPKITARTTLIQGVDDPYGTLAQLDAIERGLKGPVTRLVLENCSHSPHRDQPEACLAAIVAAVKSA